MLARRQHVLAVAAAVAGTTLAAAFGGRIVVGAAYLLAGLLGVAVHRQGEDRAVGGPAFGNALVGFALGVLGGVALATGLLVWILALPPDVALWRAGLAMWSSWAGVGTTLISGFFASGLASAVR